MLFQTFLLCALLCMSVPICESSSCHVTPKLNMSLHKFLQDFFSATYLISGLSMLQNSFRIFFNGNIFYFATLSWFVFLYIVSLYLQI